MEGVPACFLFADQVSKDTSGYRLSKACEESTGRDGIEGVQWLNGLVRIYPKSPQARNKLLMKGVTLNKVHIPVIGTNPNIVDGSEETVKLIIGKVPLSLANEEIEKALTQLPGVRIKSRLFYEHYRDDQGKLTSYKSGRRFAYVVKPANPLPKSLKIVKWNASLYHFGQKTGSAPTDSNPAGSSAPNDNALHSSATDRRSVSPPCAPSPQLSPVVPSSAPASAEDRVNNQPVLDLFFRKPTGTGLATVTTTPSSRGRSKLRQQRSRSASASRKRFPSDGDKFERVGSKARREEAPATSRDYYDFDPTRDPPQF